MNFEWREGVYDQCALYEELIRDDGKVLGCIMRFFEENCATYAMTETKRLGPKKDDRAARPAVEKALSEEERQTDVDPQAEAVGDGTATHRPYAPNNAGATQTTLRRI